jgi:hypothetical protein
VIEALGFDLYEFHCVSLLGEDVGADEEIAGLEGGFVENDIGLGEITRCFSQSLWGIRRVDEDTRDHVPREFADLEASGGEGAQKRIVGFLVMVGAICFVENFSRALATLAVSGFGK